MKHRHEGRYAEADFLYSRESWDYITEQYRERCTDPSFVDYFWMVRIMHSPLWKLMVTESFIPVKVFHTMALPEIWQANRS